MTENLIMDIVLIMLPSFLSIMLIVPTHALSTIFAYIATYITHRKYTKWQQYNTFFYQKIITPIAIAASITFIIFTYEINHTPPKMNILSNNIYCIIFVLSVILIATEILKRIPPIKTATNNIQRTIYYFIVVPLNMPIYLTLIFGDTISYLVLRHLH